MRRRRHLLRAALVTLLALIVLYVVVGSFVTVPEYAITPGAALPVSRVVRIGKARTKSSAASTIDYTYVYVGRVLLIDYLPDLLRSNIELDPAQEILGGIPSSELAAEGALEMDQSQQAAKVAALRALGYHLTGHEVGAAVAEVLPGSPAGRVLSIAEVITAVDGRATPTPSAVVKAIERERPGALLKLTVETLGVWRPHVVDLRLGERTVHGRREAYVGIAVLDQPVERYALPVPVAIAVGDLGGPSAGLAMTLGIIATATGQDLTGGIQVAATGTISPDGKVGPVGGVAEKAVAVTRAGAKVFLVPPEEYGRARAHVGHGVRVVAVDSLDQALTVLRKLRCGSDPSCPLVPAERIAGLES